MRNTSSSRRISSAMASRRASRTVCCLSLVPSGQSGVLSVSGALGAAASDLAAARALSDLASSLSSAFASLPGAALDALSMSEASSPSSSRTAMAVLTLTPSVPASIRILPMVPSSTASNSIVALSVSISAMMSPEDTVSPSLTSHLASVPSSIVGLSAGMRISIAMVQASCGTSVA